jgi:mycoredoxin
VGISWGVRWLDEFVTDDVHTTPEVEATVYWRPGCGFCSMLRAGLQREGISYREVNIWEDPDAAAFVRSVARGNETVPTVTVGSVSLVNPTAGEVVALLAGANR